MAEVMVPSTRSSKTKSLADCARLKDRASFSSGSFEISVI